MNDKVKYSVIIPCFNDRLRITQAVNSCLNQTLLPHEIIIIDDGSDDCTRKTIEHILVHNNSGNIKGVFLENNSGVSVARNRGMDIATGDFICFLDADDLWHSKKLQIIDALLSTKTNTDSIAHAFTYDHSDFASIKVDQEIKKECKTISFLDILLRNPITTPSLIIARHLALRFNEKMKFAEDHDFILRLAKRSKILYLNSKLAFISRRLGSKGGLSENSWQMRKGELKMYFNLCQADNRFYVFLPLLITYSLAKHLRSLLLKTLSRTGIS